MVERRSLNTAEVASLFADGSLTGLSDAQILQRFLKHGDESAFGALLRRYGPMVLGVCRRCLSDPNDVDDAFQATFLVLVERAGTLRERDVLGPWLHRVAHRVAVRTRVDARRRRTFEERAAAGRGSTRQGPVGGAAEAEERRFVLDEELARLAEKYRTPLVLCDLEGRTHEQAAAQIRCPVGTVKSRLSRAREQLRSRLNRRGLSTSSLLAPAAHLHEPIPVVPAGLLDATTRAAVQLAGGRATTVGAVAALVKDTLRAKHMIMLKLAATALTAVGILSAAAAGIRARLAPDDQAPASPSGPAKVVAGQGTAALQPESSRTARLEPGSDPRSRALLAKLEEPIAMSFPNGQPLEDVIKYIKQATAGDEWPDGVPIYLDTSPLDEQIFEKPESLLKTPITMDLSGVPLRLTLKLIADQIGMGYGVKDGMVRIFAPDYRRKNWRELLIVEPGGPFPETTPLQLLVEKAERGEMSDAELQQLNERLKAIEEATKRYHSIRTPQAMFPQFLPQFQQPQAKVPPQQAKPTE